MGAEALGMISKGNKVERGLQLSLDPVRQFNFLTFGKPIRAVRAQPVTAGIGIR